ncbi:MAG: oxidoreductase [Gemmatimonadota bacterium]|nr:oxidoreductase [Gemmatimonadota bacterium]
MIAFGVAVACWAAGAIAAVVAPGRRAPAVLAVVGAVVGGVAATVAGAQALGAAAPGTWSTPWRVPGGALSLRLDPLAGAFLLPLALVGGVGALYGLGYHRNHAPGRTGRASFAAYDLLLVSMALVVAASNLVLLLVAWEAMTIASWALVVDEHRDPGVRAAGVQYLVAGHVAAAALALMALLLAVSNGGFSIAPPGTSASVPAGALFVLAVIGFGTKAGIVPAHVWLPDAHASAPSHVSALMSGVMITMGFYGLARFVPLFGPPAVWWAGLLIVLGAAGAVGGILLSLAQRDVKRALAYSTVENAGLTALAVGVGLLGTAMGAPWLAALGWTAALLHLWNHALAKGLLFFGFGAMAQAAHTRDLDALGGVLRRWRTVGGAVVVGAAAVAALPGLNVFVSEWLLLRALLSGLAGLSGAARVAVLAALAALAFAGGLAVAAVTRLLGVGLLGAPRTRQAAEAVEPGWLMRGPVVALAAGCVLVAAIPQRVVAALAPAVASVQPAADGSVATAAVAPLAALVPLHAVRVAGIAGVRALWLRRSPRRVGPTWGCGFAEPAATMQYSSTSYASGVTAVMQPVLRTEVRRTTETDARTGVPVAAAWASFTLDPTLREAYLPLFAWMGRGAARLREVQRPRVSTSLLYMVVVVAVLLAYLVVPGIGR